MIELRNHIVFILLLMAVALGGIQGEPQYWRFGVGVATQNMIDGQVTTNLDDFLGYRPGDQPWNPLGLGWYFNWNWIHCTVTDQSSGQTIEYMPLVGGWGPGVHPTIMQIRERVMANPSLFPDGTTWLIGNEIIWDDQRTPSQYASDYHEFYYGIKSISPTFKIANGSVINSVYYNRPGFTGTPLELLDAVAAAYQAQYGEPWPVDVWNIHPYVWRKNTVQEELVDLQSLLTTFRDWMQARGYQDKPLIITEYGLLDYHDQQWMVDYLLGSFQILLSTGHPNGLASDEGRWVQRWAWFVNNNHVWQAGGPVQWTHCALYNGDTFDMRALGRAYAKHPKEYDYAPVLTGSGISSELLLADGSTRYTITLKASDPNGLNDIRQMRAVLYNGTTFDAANGRGYLAWGLDDYDTTDSGGTWTLEGDAEGGGRWAWCSGDWGSDTYITPISASTTASGSERTVTFTFTVKPGWAPSAGRLRVFVRGGGGLGTGWVDSGPLQVVSTLVMGDVRANPDGSSVQIPCGIVTAGNSQLMNTFYVEAFDRSSGIKVYGSPTIVYPGDLVAVAGKVASASGERQISTPTVTVLGSGVTVPKPVYVRGIDLGGAAPNAFTQGIVGGTGVYNVGLLVSTYGRVTYVDTAAKCFYLDDGSGRKTGSLPGVKVLCTSLASGNTIPLPAVGSRLIVTAVIAAQGAAGQVIPVLRPRTSGDLVTL